MVRAHSDINSSNANTRLIFIPTDFSEASGSSLRWAATQLASSGDHIVLMHTLEDITESPECNLIL